MSRMLCVIFAVGFAVVASASNANAHNCLKDHRPFSLSSDAVTWSMTIEPGAGCIQGLRWSYMQIEKVSVLDEPKNGKLIIVGSGFRYLADPEFQGTDSFKLFVSGKNRHDVGSSTIEIVVAPSNQSDKTALNKRFAVSGLQSKSASGSSDPAPSSSY